MVILLPGLPGLAGKGFFSAGLKPALDHLHPADVPTQKDTSCSLDREGNAITVYRLLWALG